MRTFFAAAVVSVLSSGCALGSSADSASSVSPVELDALTAVARKGDAPVVRSPSKRLETDWCDEAFFNDVTWLEKTEGNLTFRYAPGSAAETDLAEIASTRREMYLRIAQFLRVAEPGPVKIVLSPNRVAATKNGHGLGWSLLSKSTAEVVYTGAPGSFEKRSPGHELAHIIASKIDGALYHLPFLDEGLAELLDGSGRDLHAAYISEIRASYSSTSVTRLTSEDLSGRSYGRAGSFVKFLVDRYGVEKFLALWKASSVTWSGSTPTTKAGLKVKTAADLEAAMSQALLTTHGVSFEGARREWEKTLAPYFVTPAEVDGDDASEIKDVIRHADNAINSKNRWALRSTMEGFYCDWYSDQGKLDMASAAVELRGTVKTDVVSILPNNTRNFPEVIVYAIRTEVRSGVETKTAEQIWMEKFPIGWRVTSATF